MTTLLVSEQVTSVSRVKMKMSRLLYGNEAVRCLFLPSNNFSTSGYIKQNKYYLIDVTGLPTRWGVWAPEQINLNQSWADEHGLNSLQILTYLLSAYRVTGKGDYLEGWLVRGRGCCVCVCPVCTVALQSNCLHFSELVQRDYQWTRQPLWHKHDQPKDHFPS